MKKVKQKEIFILIIVHLCLFLIATSFLAVYSIFSYKQFTNEVNAWVGGVIECIQEKYPAITEEELIDLLNSENKDNPLLQNIGINEENIAIISLEKRQKRTFLVGLLSLIVLEIFVIIFTLFLHFRKNKSINKIINYVKEINKKNYTLEIEEHGESELSILKSELYKITVMLKEESENAKEEKDAIRKSVEDISHQLKTPLTSIRILLDNLEDIEMNSSMQKEFLHDISNQIENMNFLTISLLKLARFDAGVVVMKQEPILLYPLFLNVRENLSILLELKNQELMIAGKEDMKIIGDYSWQLEAFINIIKNCIEHSEENSKIEVNFKETLFYTKILIKDYGEGIPKKDMGHIFERFYKSSNASRDSIGIGLSLSKTIIEANHGYITCKSEMGIGTIFEIKYPKK